jgi:hypothetical protein
MRVLTVVVGVLSTIGSGSAYAQDPAFTKDSFPLELAARPLVLPAGMMEVRAGAMSDFVGLERADPQVRSRLDVSWSPLPRAMLGVDTDLTIFPTENFEIRDIAGWAEYSLHPKLDFRLGAYAQLPSQPAMDGSEGMELGDTLLGIRAGLPIKVGLGNRLAIAANPRYGALVAGGDQQDFDMPFTVFLSPIPQISLYASSGVRVQDLGNFSLDDANVFIDVPAIAGAVLSPGNLMDLGVDVRVVDVSDEDGRARRWVFAYLTLRR